MDPNLTEAMKNILAKGMQTDLSSQINGTNYITEKLYMLLQLYLQNKGWNPSLELLQCFTELKEASMLPSASCLQMLASRVALDSQGRLILRESGKIILPFEHFANAVMLKHMNGLHGLHLSLEATIRAVVESYTIGRENFGMEKEFIIEVVQSCPSSGCRHYKTQQDNPSALSSKPTYIPEMPPVSSGVSISLVPCSENSTSMAPPAQPTSITSVTPRPHSASPSRPSSADLTFESSKVPADLSSHTQPLLPPSPKISTKALTPRQIQQNKLADFLKANLENLDNISGANKDSSNEVWNEDGKRQDAGQEKIVRTFSEIMKNMAKMKACVRPAMCKPYGKQSEALQKTVIDTIQLVQSLRSFLPPPHIAVSSWKNEDKHSRMERKANAAAALINNSNSMNSDDCDVSVRNKSN